MVCKISVNKSTCSDLMLQLPKRNDQLLNFAVVLQLKSPDSVLQCCVLLLKSPDLLFVFLLLKSKCLCVRCCVAVKES